MKKSLFALLVLFLLVDIVLAIRIFNLGNLNDRFVKFFPKNCKVLDLPLCSTAQIIGNEKLNETVAALFKLPKDTKIYSPVNGTLEFQLMGGTNLPYHTIKADSGVMYILVFEPKSKPQTRQVKSGEVIGITTGRTYSAMKDRTLGVSVLKNQQFDKGAFDSLFR